MNTISAQEIKRRGISALDELLKDGPVHVIKNNRRAMLIGRKGLWELLDPPTRGTRSKKDIDAQRLGRLCCVE